jgi:fatty acid synthase subunit beta
MEARGEFTVEGCIEMAWLIGHIKHVNGHLKDGSLYVGWVDLRLASLSMTRISEVTMRRRF